MGISKFNSEGYSDPTSHAALSGIRREERAARRAYRPLVYICSPFAGDTEGNVQKAVVEQDHTVWGIERTPENDNPHTGISGGICPFPEIEKGYGKRPWRLCGRGAEGRQAED